MLKFSTTFIFTIFILTTQACDETKVQKLEATADPVPYSRPLQYMTILILNSTITCSNMSSLDSIDHHFQETYYDQFLKIVNSTIATVPAMAFSKSPFLKKMFLSGNNIETITPGAFTGLKNLEHLSIDHNNLTIVSHLVFNSLYELRVLDLSYNEITRIEKFALMGLNKLEELNLRHNDIVSVEDGVFKSLRRLSVVNLSENPLLSVSVKGLKSLDTLLLVNTSLSQLSFSNFTTKMLNLSSSQFVFVNFTDFPQSEELNFSNNNIVSIVGSLRSKFVNLHHNKIERVEATFLRLLHLRLSHNNLYNLTDFLSFSPEIQELDLDNNNITTISKSFFRGLKSLALLSLEKNNLSRIEPTLFQDLTNLKALNLSDNDLTSLAYGTFDSLSQLEILDVSNNNLHELDQLHPLVNLQHLWFDNNMVSSLGDLRFFQQLKTMSLDKNPWKCQDLVRAEAKLRNMSVLVLPGSTYDVDNFHGVACDNTKKVESDFEKFLRFLKSTERYEVEKLTSVEEVPQDYTSRIFVYVVVVQIVVLMLLLFVVFLIFKYVKNRKIEEPKRRSFPDFEMF